MDVVEQCAFSSFCGLLFSLSASTPTRIRRACQVPRGVGRSGHVVTFVATSAMQAQAMVMRKVIIRRHRYDGHGEPASVEVEIVTNRGAFRCCAEDDGDTDDDIKAQEVALSERLAGTNVTRHDIVQRAIADAAPRYGMLVSGAALRAAAEFEDKLYMAYVKEKCGQTGVDKKRILPLLAFTVFSGGCNAGNMSPIRGVGIVPTSALSLAEAVRMSVEVYYHARALARDEFGGDATNTGECGGLAAPSSSLDSHLDLATRAIARAGFEERVGLWIDVGAEDLYDPATRTYNMSPKAVIRTPVQPSQLLRVYQHWLRRYPIIAFEDPFACEDAADQEDVDAWATLAVDAQLITTARVGRGLVVKCPAALVTLPLHSGTLYSYPEQRRSFQQKHNVSHVFLRTDRTTDANDVLTATALGMSLIRFGAPVRGENTAKINELLRMEEALAGTGKTWAYGKRHHDMFNIAAPSRTTAPSVSDV